MRLLVFIALTPFSWMIAGSGCGGSFCDDTKACPNDPAPSPDEKKASESQCKASLDAVRGQACEGESERYASCVKAVVVCGSDGKTDDAATQAKRATSCSSERAAAIKCCLATPSRACG